MVVRLVSIVVALVAMNAGYGVAVEQPGPDRISSIQRAVFAEGRLWLLDTGGRLSSMAGGGERSDVATPEPVIELFVQDGRVAIVTCPQEFCVPWTSVERWTVRRRDGDGWGTVANIATKGEKFVAATSTLLLTDSRMIDLTGGELAETALTSSSTSSRAAPRPLNEGKDFRFGGAIMLLEDGRTIDLTEGMPWEAAPLMPSSNQTLARKKPLRRSPAASVLLTAKHVFVGYNAGEWGGGLQRIDRITGIVSDIDDVEGDLCGGKLNPECDPVNGIAIIPWKPHCIAVAVGLIHMAAHGRIVEVCDASMRQLYQHVIQAPTDQTPDGRTRISWFAQTTAFFGLQRQGEDLLAMGHDGLYRIGQGDVVRQIPFPNFKPIDGVAVSFDIPGLVLLLTTANRRFSVSGSTPMLVPR
ncbi:hypothetical protein [Bradyrhizobium sp. HKCCYLR1023]|uniref:hypothetical protein n=1 Tax=Bradyrhizobium TaxID=374 RepID=UPI003EC129A8